jgi:hypothetical protein
LRTSFIVWASGAALGGAANAIDAPATNKSTSITSLELIVFILSLTS